MPLTQPTSSAERRVLAWLLALLFVAAALLITVTWWRKSAACAATCAAAGHAGSQLVWTGGGRFGMTVQCQCVGAPAGK